MTNVSRGRPNRRPELLSNGDLVALISPSSHLGDTAEAQLSEARDILTGWGLQVASLRDVEPRHLYFAGKDSERAEQFQNAYLDPEIKALFFTRGGYGAARILPLLDTDAITKAPPKPVVGFSDATAIFTWLDQVADVSALHAPCLAAPSLLNSETRVDDLEALRRALFEPDEYPEFPIRALDPRKETTAEVEGILAGGCLAVVVTSLGTPWEIETEGRILFLEDIGEAPYRLDRMLAHLRSSGKLKDVAGVVFGHLTHCDSDPPGLLEEVLQDFFSGDKFPVAAGLPAGHGSPNRALWLGQRVRFQLAADGTGRFAFSRD